MEDRQLTLTLTLPINGGVKNSQEVNNFSVWFFLQRRVKFQERVKIDRYKDLARELTPPPKKPNKKNKLKNKKTKQNKTKKKQPKTKKNKNKNKKTQHDKIKQNNSPLTNKNNKQTKTNILIKTN